MLRQIAIALLFLGLPLSGTASSVASARPKQEKAPVLSQTELASRFHRLLDRPHVPAEPVLALERKGEYAVERGRIHVEANESVPIVLYKAEKATGRLPVVIVLHGTGGTKELMEPYLVAFAGMGFLAVAIDARYHGERVTGGAHKSLEYQEAITRAWREKDPHKQEHPFYYDTVWDLWRTLDYLQTRSDVDPKRIGMIGFSMGGIETWLCAATDPRVAVAVPIIAVQGFRWSLEHDRWQGRAGTIPMPHAAAATDLKVKQVDQAVCRALWSKVITGILDEFDCPNMLRAIAPRPLLILNGANDPNNPLGGARVAIDAAEEAYSKEKAADRLMVEIAGGVGHRVTHDQMHMAYDWLVRWLKPHNPSEPAPAPVSHVRTAASLRAGSR